MGKLNKNECDNAMEGYGERQVIVTMYSFLLLPPYKLFLSPMITLIHFIVLLFHSLKGFCILH